MFPAPLRSLPWAVLCMTACVFSNLNATAAEIVAGPEEAGLRAAIASAQNDDVVIITTPVELHSPLHITNRLTIRARGDFWNGWIHGSFDGVLIKITGARVVFEGMRITGSPVTDGLHVESEVILRDCYLDGLRHPVVSDFWQSPGTKVRLERVTVTGNQEAFQCQNLEAKDSTFSWSSGNGAGAWYSEFDGCRFEHNKGDGLSLLYGTVKNCLFRYNGDFGLRFDPDPGVLYLSGSVFYANAGGGLLLREEAHATVDNCTFTRHTGRPAVVVTEAHNVLFRHCTVVDNLVIDPGSSPWYPSGNAFAIGSSGRVELQNCLVASNPTSEAPDASGMDTGWIDGGGNVIGGDPKLDVLRDNGGPMPSMLPLSGSPALDAGWLSDVLVDARGLSRLAGTAPDAGAVEVNAEALADTDEDGLPDLWELRHGLDLNNSADATSDGDGDGANALAEFLTRTSPTDSGSVARFAEVILPTPPTLQPYPRMVYFTWFPAPGATYEVETSTDLRQWRKSAAIYQSAGQENNRLKIWHQIEADSPMSFYRLVLKPSPFE